MLLPPPAPPVTQALDITVETFGSATFGPVNCPGCGAPRVCGMSATGWAKCEYCGRA
jgi:ribosomal protein S27E